MSNGERAGMTKREEVILKLKAFIGESYMKNKPLTAEEFGGGFADIIEDLLEEIERLEKVIADEHVRTN